MAEEERCECSHTCYANKHETCKYKKGNKTRNTEPDFSSEMVEVTGIPVIKVMSDPAKPHNTTIAQRRTNPHERTYLAIHRTSSGISSAYSRHFLNLNRGTYVESPSKHRSQTTKRGKHGRSTCQPHHLRRKLQRIVPPQRAQYQRRTVFAWGLPEQNRTKANSFQTETARRTRL